MTLCYHTMIDGIRRPDGSQAPVGDNATRLVCTTDERTAARLAADAYLNDTPRLPPPGSIIHVHVSRQPKDNPPSRPVGWDIDIYVDTEAPTLH